MMSAAKQWTQALKHMLLDRDANPFGVRSSLALFVLSSGCRCEGAARWCILAPVIPLTSYALVNIGLHSYSVLVPADGPELAFALIFGWLYGIIYLVPWLAACQLTRLLWASNASIDALTHTETEEPTTGRRVIRGTSSRTRRHNAGTTIDEHLKD